jgi:hypothetical protein
LLCGNADAEQAPILEESLDSVEPFNVELEELDTELIQDLAG